MTDINSGGVAKLAERVQRLEDIEAIKALKARYCARCDDGYDSDGIAELYTEDAVWDGGNTFGVREGREAIRKHFEAAASRVSIARHHVMNPVIEVDGDTAWVATDFAFVSRANTILSTGRYLDAMCRSPDRWRLASREIVFSGDTPVGVEG